ncbi:unnamed protein product [Urochloa humidicola]
MGHPGGLAREKGTISATPVGPIGWIGANPTSSPRDARGASRRLLGESACRSPPPALPSSVSLLRRLLSESALPSSGSTTRCRDAARRRASRWQRPCRTPLRRRCRSSAPGGSPLERLSPPSNLASGEQAGEELE